MGWHAFRQTCGFSISFRWPEPQPIQFCVTVRCNRALLPGQRKHKVILAKQTQFFPKLRETKTHLSLVVSFEVLGAPWQGKHQVILKNKPNSSSSSRNKYTSVRRDQKVAGLAEKHTSASALQRHR